MNVLVTGANGQLGMSLRKRAETAGWVFTDIVEAPGVDTVRLDITDPAAIRSLVRERAIDTIVNCAAFTSVDAAESQPALAALVNAQAAENLAFAMLEVGGLLLQISTDYVFSGEGVSTPIREDHPCAPTSVYGRTKWEGEQAIRRTGCRHLIIRTSWLYSEFGRNFVLTMLRLTATRPQIRVVDDQVGTPTYAGDLAGAILAILPSFAVPNSSFAGLTGESPSTVYHFSNEGSCSWYEFARTIAEISGHTACEILPCKSDEYPSPVRRPAYSVLDKTLIRQIFGLTIPAWQESLRVCLAEISRAECA